jgi:hypothetical protein
MQQQPPPESGLQELSFNAPGEPVTVTPYVDDEPPVLFTFAADYSLQPVRQHPRLPLKVPQLGRRLDRRLGLRRPASREARLLEQHGEPRRPRFRGRTSRTPAAAP